MQHVVSLNEAGDLHIHYQFHFFFVIFVLSIFWTIKNEVNERRDTLMKLGAKWMMILPVDSNLDKEFSK